MALGSTIDEVLSSLRARFMAAGIDSGAIDARILLAGLINLPAASISTRGTDKLPASDLKRIEDAADRRLAGEPVHRILGHRDFYALDLLLSPDTLEPRPDTETLIDIMVPYVRAAVSQKGSAEILDLGTGTGAIAIALLDNVRQARAAATDLAKGALVTATENARRLGVADRFIALESNWFEAVNGKFDIIVSNPPYIPTAIIAGLSREVGEHDPLLALDGGQDGLDAYRAIAAGCSSHLMKGGRIGVEIGFDQKRAVREIFRAEGLACIHAEKDLGGNDRVLVFAGNS